MLLSLSILKAMSSPILWIGAPDVKEPRVSECRTRSLHANVCNVASCSNAVCALDSSDTDYQIEETSNSCERLGSTVTIGVEMDLTTLMWKTLDILQMMMA